MSSSRSLQGVRGVGRVERIGGVEREILVALDPDRLQAVGLTASDVSRRLRGTQCRLAGGRAEIGGRDQAIRTLAGAKTLDELAGTMISLPARRRGSARRSGRRHRHRGGAAHVRALRRTAGRRLQHPALQGRQRSRRRGSNVEKRLAEIKAAHPDVDLKLIDHVGHLHARATTNRRCTPCLRAPRSRCSSSFCSCGIARHVDRGGHAAAVHPAGVLGDGCHSASRSTW